MTKAMFKTGIKWFGQPVFMRSTGDKAVDLALRTTFHDKFHRTAPLEMRRADVQLALAYSRGELESEADND